VCRYWKIERQDIFEDLMRQFTAFAIEGGAPTKPEGWDTTRESDWRSSRD